jgi:hypothetical protein
MPFIVDIDDDGNPELNEAQAAAISRNMLSKATDGFMSRITGAFGKGKEVNGLATEALKQHAEDADIEENRKNYERNRAEVLKAAGKSAAHRAAYRDIMREPAMKDDDPELGIFTADLIERRAASAVKDTQIIDDIGVKSIKHPDPVLKPQKVRRKNNQLCR